MKKTIRIGLLFICYFINITLSYASPHNLRDLQQNGEKLIRCQECQQRKSCHQNPKCNLCHPCPPGPPGSTITRLFAYGSAYNNGTTEADLVISIGEVFRYTVFSTNTRVTFNPSREITIEETGDYLIKFIASVGETLFSFPAFVGLKLNGEEVSPSFFTVAVPETIGESSLNAYILKGQLILPLTAGDQLELIVPSSSIIGVFLNSSSAAGQPTLNTTLSVEKLN
jgi:hypothetical protein